MGKSGIKRAEKFKKMDSASQKLELAETLSDMILIYKKQVGLYLHKINPSSVIQDQIADNLKLDFIRHKKPKKT